MYKKILFLLLIFIFNSNCHAKTLNVIRDQETENFIYRLAYPILKVAGVGTDLQIVLVNDSSANAFVMNKKYIFVHLGLIQFCDNADSLAGVLAHEIGHIAADHNIKIDSFTQTMNVSSLVGQIIGATIAFNGAQEVGMAVSAGIQNIATQGVLRFSREKEAMADALAVKYLQQVEYPSKGLEKVLKAFAKVEKKMHHKHLPFLLSHPLSEERLASVSNMTASDKTKFPDMINNQLNRIKKKIESSLYEISYIKDKYTFLDSDEDKYNMAIINIRVGELQKAIDTLIDLSRVNINDPYTYELLGEAYYKSGEFKKSITSLRCAINKLDDFDSTDVLDQTLSMSLIAEGSVQSLNEAVIQLNKCLKYDPKNIALIYKLAMVYDKLDNRVMSYIKLCEKAYIEHNSYLFKVYFEVAQKLVDKNSVEEKLLYRLQSM